MVRTNVERNWTDLDNRGYSLYQSITTINLPQASYDFFSITYLFLLQTLNSQNRRLTGALTRTLESYIERRPFNFQVEEYLASDVF